MSVGDIMSIKFFLNSVMLFSIIMVSTVGYCAPMKIAILDFHDLNTKEQIAPIISETLITELVNSKKFTVVERSKIKAILREQGLQQTGALETEDAVAAGRLLTVQKVFIGTFSKLGDSFIINIRVVNVEKGEMEYAVKKQFLRLEKAVTVTESLAKEIEMRYFPSAVDNQIIKKDELIIEKEDKKVPVIPSKETIRPYKWHGIAALSAGAVLVASGVFFNSKAKDEYDKYDKYKNAGSDFDELWKKAEDGKSQGDDYIMYRNITYGVGAGAVVAGAVLLFITKEKVSSPVAVSVSEDTFLLTFNQKF